MIDNDLTRELTTLANTVGNHVDLAALHRRVSRQNRSRGVIKVGVATGGIAAVVGGLFVVRDARSGATETSLAAAGQTAATSSPSASPSTVPALPACDSVVIPGPTKPTEAEAKAAQAAKDAANSTGPTLAEGDFKGVVTILAVDGQQLTFRVDEPKIVTPETRKATLDAATVWMNGPTAAGSAADVHAGDHVGLATAAAGSGGTDRVLLVDLTAATTASGATAKDKSTDSSIVAPGVTLAPGPTTKSVATITEVGAASVNAIVNDGEDNGKTVAFDPTVVPVYAGNVRCLPGTLAVGTQVGIAYHVDAAGTLVADDVLLMR